MDQQIQYCTTPDGVRLAYSVTGKGSPIVRPSHWLTHLEYDLKSPVWRHLVLGLSQRHSFVRYDARGEGMSQRDVTDISFERWVSDLETVVDKLALTKIVLLGISQSASVAIAYAARHPDRVSHLILYGGFARGFLYQGDMEKQKQLLELSRTLVREGWGSDQDTYRQWFTSQFIPGGTAEQARWFNELERVCATPEVAERHLVASAEINLVDLLPKIKVPTLVLHCRGDLRVPFSSGEELAAGIPGARFVPLEGKNHLFLANEPAHRSFFDAIASFLGDPPIRGPLPGTENRKERLENAVAQIEKNWLIKIIIILAAITGVIIFFVELWGRLHH
jgi:pimeloyl-ACP methyl ester carboxylesterase